MVIQIFQLFLFIAYRRQRLFVGDDFHVHRGGHRECKLLLLVVEDFRRWKIQLPYDIVNREVGGIRRLIFTFQSEVSLIFFYQAACRTDKVIPLYQRFPFQLFYRKVIGIVLIGNAGLAVDMLQKIAEVLFLQTAHLEPASDFILQ